MQLEGIHHTTAITGDAPGNVDFYARVLGMRLVKKTVNQDDPTVYHLFYVDEEGHPGLDLTFFEYPGAAPGRPGAGMVHRIASRVGAPRGVGALDGGGRAVARAGKPGGGAAHPGDRPLLLPLDLLPRAERRAVGDRDDRARLRSRRGPRAPGRAALAPPGLRAPA